MRLTTTLVLAGAALAAAATALPASAQAGYYGRGYNDGYRDPCVAQKNNQIGGLIVGGLLGAALGSNIAGRGHRDDGTALGAVVGGVMGSEIGRGSSRPCAPPPPPAYSTGYPVSGVYDAPPAYGRDYDRDYDNRSYYPERDERSLAGRDRYPYNGDYRDSDYAGTDCTSAEQVTKLPDGTKISRPVEACREMRYGGWTIKD